MCAWSSDSCVTNQPNTKVRRKKIWVILVFTWAKLVSDDDAKRVEFFWHLNNSRLSGNREDGTGSKNSDLDASQATNQAIAAFRY